MNKIITIVLAVVGMVCAGNVNAANKTNTIYAFGFSASFTDSIVYFTDVQQLQGVVLERKTHFLQDREAYSHQLSDYLVELGMGRRVCVFYYEAKQKKIEKVLAKLKKKYVKNGKYDIKHLAINDFQFKVIEQDEIPQEVQTEKKVSKKAKRKSKTQEEENK